MNWQASIPQKRKPWKRIYYVNKQRGVRLYSAEKKALEGLDKMRQAASSQELKSAFEEHHAQTQQQVSRIEQIFTDLGQQPPQKPCPALDGLVQEAEMMIQSAGAPSPVLDAGLIGAAQKVEHLEIAGYGTAVVHAQHLGNSKAVDLLKQTLNEEEKTDQKLTHLAETMINSQAAQTV